MNGLASLVLAACFALSGCESLGGPDRLIADLQVTGLPAGLGTEFDGVVLGGQGTTVCVGEESVQVHEFVDAAAAMEAAATVDRADPSMVGNAIVEWIGPPRFWLRDQVIVLYVGDDAAVDAALRTILGRPFAEDPGWGGRGAPGVRPPCVRAS